MSKTREARLWQWLRKGRPRFKELLVLDRVENSLMKGMADVNGCLDGQDFWIELKTSARPSDTTTPVKIKFQNNQPEWHRKRQRAGARTFLLLQVGSGTGARRYLIDGALAGIVRRGLKEETLATLAFLPPQCSAEEILQRVGGHGENHA